MEKHNRKHVCVVGAGIAGLVTAKVLQEDGFDVVVFEKESAVGGVWAASRTYPGLRTNGPCETYAFSDFPYPQTTDDFPSAEQVRCYLESYVDHFGIRSRIRLSTKVVSISRTQHQQHPRFAVVVRPLEGSAIPETLHFDYVAICNGVFSKPHMPHIPGMKGFIGQVLHSSQITDTGLIEGKRVLIVGAGKSALDCATLAAQHADSSTLIFRQPHWMVPRYFFGLIRMDKLLMTRFSEFFLRYHRMNRLEAFLHHKGKFLVRLFWRMQNWLIPRLLKIPPVLMPKQRLPMGFESVGVGGEFYKALRQGNLIPKQGRITSFSGAKKAQLDTGEQIEADVVIFATGWRQDIAFLDDDLLDLIQKVGHFHLFRHILPPEEPHLGFVGYASSIASQFTSEIAAHWLSQHFRGELVLPSKAEMEHEIDKVRDWTAEVFPARKEGYFIGAYVSHYIDELMRDMDLPTVRTGNFLAEHLAPFWPERYKEVKKERQHASSLDAAPG